MTTAIKPFTVRDEKGRPQSFKPGDEVPDEIAALVGAHVLDQVPEVDDTPSVEELTAAGADEKLVAVLADKDAEIELLTEQVEELETELKTLREFHEKVTSGDLSDLDLDSIGTPPADPGKPEGEPVPPAQPLFDPSEHNVATVLAHLEGADEAEDARVRGLERAGKARAGILGDDA